MDADTTLIDAALMKRKKGADLIIPSSMASKIQSDNIIVYYIGNKDQLNVIGLDDGEHGYDPSKHKIFNLLLMLSKEDMKFVVQTLSMLFSRVKGGFRVIWQTGICDVKTTKYEGCIWQGLIMGPRDQTPLLIEQAILEHNKAIGSRVFKGASAEEVVIIHE